ADDPRPQPPFPTRRSSDLSATNADADAVEEPLATRTASPPFFEIDQIDLPIPLKSRVQKTRVEFRAITVPFVSSLGASTNASNRNSALTLVSACSVSWQVADIPLQAVPQPAKLKPLSAVAVSVTEVPAAKSAAQVEESQSKPPREEITRPFPWTITLRRCWFGGGGGSVAKVALSSRSPSKVRSH